MNEAVGNSHSACLHFPTKLGSKKGSRLFSHSLPLLNNLKGYSPWVMVWQRLLLACVWGHVKYCDLDSQWATVYYWIPPCYGSCLGKEILMFTAMGKQWEWSGQLRCMQLFKLLYIYSILNNCYFNTGGLLLSEFPYYTPKHLEAQLEVSFHSVSFDANH